MRTLRKLFLRPLTSSSTLEIILRGPRTGLVSEESRLIAMSLADLLSIPANLLQPSYYGQQALQGQDGYP